MSLEADRSRCDICSTYDWSSLFSGGYSSVYFKWHQHNHICEVQRRCTRYVFFQEPIGAEVTIAGRACQVARKLHDRGIWCWSLHSLSAYVAGANGRTLRNLKLFILKKKRQSWSTTLAKLLLRRLRWVVNQKPDDSIWLRARSSEQPSFASFALPSFSERNHSWTSSPMTASEATFWLREFIQMKFSELSLRDIGSHSCKCTLLTSAGRSVLVQFSPSERRLLLGHHLEPNMRSIMVYSREAFTTHYWKVLSMFVTIRDGSCIPDLLAVQHVEGSQHVQTSEVVEDAAPGVEQVEISDSESSESSAASEMGVCFRRGLQRVLEKSFVEQCCGFVFERSVVENCWRFGLWRSVVEKFSRNMLEKRIVEKCCRELLYTSIVENSVVEECCRVAQQSVVEKCCREGCCREVLEKSSVERCCREECGREMCEKRARETCCREMLEKNVLEKGRVGEMSLRSVVETCWEKCWRRAVSAAPAVRILYALVQEFAAVSTLDDKGAVLLFAFFCVYATLVWIPNKFDGCVCHEKAVAADAFLARCCDARKHEKKGCHYWSSVRFMGCSRFCAVSKPFWFHLNLCMAAKIVLQTFSLRVGIVLVCCPQVVRFAVVWARSVWNIQRHTISVALISIFFGIFDGIPSVFIPTVDLMTNSGSVFFRKK